MLGKIWKENISYFSCESVPTFCHKQSSKQAIKQASKQSSKFLAHHIYFAEAKSIISAVRACQLFDKQSSNQSINQSIKQASKQASKFLAHRIYFAEAKSMKA